MFSRIKSRVMFALKGPIYAARARGVKIGEGCRLYSLDFGGEPWLISIGDRVTITGGVQFVTHDGASWLLRDSNGRRHRYAPIEIGNDVFIGASSIILPGVRIGNRVIVGAGSVVNRSIPDNCVVAGVPIKFIRTYDEFERRGLQEFRSDSEMKGETRRDRVDSIVDEKMVPEIPVPASLNSGNGNEVQSLSGAAPLSELADKHPEL